MRSVLFACLLLAVAFAVGAFRCQTLCGAWRCGRVGKYVACNLFTKQPPIVGRGLFAVRKAPFRKPICAVLQAETCRFALPNGTIAQCIECQAFIGSVEVNGAFG